MLSINVIDWVRSSVMSLDDIDEKHHDYKNNVNVPTLN